MVSRPAKLLPGLLLMLSATVIVGCHKEPDPVQNGMFQYPRWSEPAQDAETAGEALKAAPLFTGIYPEFWPAALSFPPETYVVEGFTRTEEPLPTTTPILPEYTVLRFECVAKGSAEDIAAHFQRVIAGSGLSVRRETSLQDEMPCCCMAHAAAFELTDPAQLQVVLIMLYVIDYEGMRGYTEFDGYLVTR